MFDVYSCTCTYRYMDGQRHNNLTVRFVEGVIGTRDGPIEFVDTDDMVSMEGHIKSGEINRKYDVTIRKVDSYTVKTFVTKYKIPRMFTLLSIDAEGKGNPVSYVFSYVKLYIINKVIYHNSKFRRKNCKGCK